MAIIQFLKCNDIHHIFGVSGANIEELLIAADQDGEIKIVLAKDESSSVAMAQAYYLKTNRPGVIFSTSGGGAFNLISPLVESLESEIPLMALVGQTDQSLEGKGGFQDSSGISSRVNAKDLFSQVTLSCAKPDGPIDTIKTLNKLFTLAQKERGPCVLLLKKNLLSKKLLCLPKIEATPVVDKVNAIEQGNITFLLNALEDCVQPPLIILGELNKSLKESFAFKKFIEYTGGHVAVTPEGKGSFDNYSPRFLGVCGVMGHTEVKRFLETTELVITIGTRMPYLARYQIEDLLLRKKVININTSTSFLESKSMTTISTLNESFFNNVVEKIELGTHSISALTDFTVQDNELVHDETSFSSQAILGTLNKYIDRDADIFVDAGNTGANVVHHLKVSGKGLFSMALSMGGMGHTFGAAIGSCFLSNNRTYVFSGDGSFYMKGMEIHTAVEHNLPITYFIFNNNSHGMCHVREEVFYRANTGTNVFKKTMIGAGMNEMYPGLTAYEVNSIEELKQTLKKSTNKNGPILFSLNIDHNEVPPFSTFQ